VGRGPEAVEDVVGPGEEAVGGGPVGHVEEGVQAAVAVVGRGRLSAGQLVGDEPLDVLAL
jgi:hypothetical protein